MKKVVSNSSSTPHYHHNVKRVNTHDFVALTDDESGGDYDPNFERKLDLITEGA
jgi:hypothetical protein